MFDTPFSINITCSNLDCGLNLKKFQLLVAAQHLTLWSLGKINLIAKVRKIIQQREDMKKQLMTIILVKIITIHIYLQSLHQGAFVSDVFPLSNDTMHQKSLST